LWRIYLVPIPSSLWAFSTSWLPWGEQLSSTMSFCHDVLLQHQPRNMEPSDHGPRPLKLWASFKLFFSGVCHSNEKSNTSNEIWIPARGRGSSCKFVPSLCTLPPPYRQWLLPGVSLPAFFGAIFTQVTVEVSSLLLFFGGSGTGVWMVSVFEMWNQKPDAEKAPRESHFTSLSFTSSAKCK
jgi:hypothetical protein